MKSSIHKQRTRIAQFGVLLFALFGFAELAVAATLAADHVIRNEVLLDYDDASGNAQGQQSASVDILVNLVATEPLLTDVTLDTLDPVSLNDTVTLLFNVTSRANGLDGYYVTNVVDSTTSLIGSTTAVTPDADAFTPLDLGGSSFASGTTITTFDTAIQTNGTTTGTAVLVPADSVGGGAELSGFVVDDFIVLAGTAGVAGDVTCRVNHIVEPAALSEANATATIYVDQCDVASGPILTEGDQIGERGQISITVVGTAVDAISLTFDVVSEDTPATLTSAGPVLINIVAVDLDVYKFVRNLNAANNPSSCGTGSPFLCLTIEAGATDVTYYRATSGQSGVTVDPGDTLEYAILLYNNNGLVTDVSISDDIVLFTAYLDDSAILIPQAIANGSGATCAADTGGTCVIDDGAGAAPTATTVAGVNDTTINSSFIFFDSGTILVSAGDNGSGIAVNYNGANTGGQIAASSNAASFENEASVLTFQVTVDGTP